MFLKSDLVKHQRSHCHFTDGHTASTAKLESEVILGNVEESTASEFVRSKVFPSMQDDEIKKAAIQDQLIVELGNSWGRKARSNKAKSKNYVSQKMRECGRLLIQLRELEPDKKDASMWQFLAPNMFDLCVRAAIETAGEIAKDKELKNPSVAIKNGHNLERLAAIKRALSIRENDDVGIKEAERFLTLKDTEWIEKITSLARSNLATRKFNKPANLPKSEDITKVTEYLKNQLAVCSTDGDKSNMQDYRELQTLVLARLMTFNRRRPGEIEQMLVTSYTDRPDWVSAGLDTIKEVMTPLESKLVKTLDMVELRGKRGRKVPVLIPVECKAPMAQLMMHRNRVGIPSTNIYFFATTGEGCLRAGDCLDKIVQRLKLAKPAAMKVTPIRKYIATFSQVLDLGENQLEWLANHLGHDVSVHRQYYRLQESTLEMAKISKLLMLVDSGKGKEYLGKNLDDINIEDLCLPDETEAMEEEGDEDEVATGIPPTKRRKVQSTKGMSLVKE
ncbi:uncharacterized protein LOC135489946 [Lineus longissimus]|uniref:uncharacterized protein LOC135489946 n=1 Tax=Lineus longissimus TaxID=88925 RepID=UPI00315D50DC